MWKYLTWFGFILVLLVGIGWYQWPKNGVKVVWCDVGQGDGAVVQNNFSQLLIDTGPPGGMMESCLGKVMPFWDKTIEVIVISHADKDHSGGLDEILRHYRVKQVVVSEASRQEIASVLPKTTNLVVSGQGDRWHFGLIGGEVIWPLRGSKLTTDLNNESLVWRMEYNGHSIWWAGDVDKEVEQLMMMKNGVRPTEILKLAHHGSKSSTSDRFLTILRPSQIVISVGKNNRYGHPSDEVMEKLRNTNTLIWRTDKQGSRTIMWQ